MRTKSIYDSLSHIARTDDRGTMLCGRGFGAKGYPSITTVSFPSVKSLPGCRTCREAFLTSIGVEFNEHGYPK
jgi:hypothetical protein